MSEIVDCGDKTCSMHFQYKDSCLVYLETNVSNCNIPCDFSGCNYKFASGHCRIWDCVDNPSTSTTSTSTTSTTFVPDTTVTTETTTFSTTTEFPPPNPTPSDSAFYASIISFVINGLLVALVLFLFVVYVKNCIRLRRFERSGSTSTQGIPMRRYNSQHFEGSPDEETPIMDNSRAVSEDTDGNNQSTPERPERKKEIFIF